MKPIKGVLVSSIVAASLLGSTSAWAAGLSGDALRTDKGQIMADITTQAGIGDFEDKDGAAASAAFRSPTGVIQLADGSILVADTRNHNIRKISGAAVSTFAGPELPVLVNDLGFPVGGKADGQASEAFFSEPAGLAADASGSVYVADAGNNSIRKIAKDGTVTTLAGGQVGFKDGKGAEAQFNYPTDLAVAADGTVYVADALNHAIRKIAADGTVTTLNAASTRAIQVKPGEASFAGDYQDGSLAQAKFNEPSGLAIDAKGNLYVSDTGNQRIRYIDLAAGTVSTVAGSGTAADGSGLYETDELYAGGDFADGAALEAKFDFPKGIAVTSEGGLLIADSLNHSIRYLFDGQVTTLAGSIKTGEYDGVESAAQFYSPSDVAVAADGSVIVADSFNNKIRKVKPYQLPAGLPAEGIKVVHNRDAITFDAQPELTDGRTMVPVRAISEAFGYEVKYEEREGAKAVQLVKGDVTVELYIGQTGVKKLETGKAAVSQETDAAPYIKQDRTYVPVRFFAEQIGLDVQWDAATKTAILREKSIAK